TAAELASDQLSGDQQRGDRHDGAESPERHRFGLDRSLRLGHGEGLRRDERREPRQVLRDPGSYGAEVAWTASDPDPRDGVVDAAGEELTRESGREDVVGCAPGV